MVSRAFRLKTRKPDRKFRFRSGFQTLTYTQNPLSKYIIVLKQAFNHFFLCYSLCLRLIISYDSVP